MRKVSEILIAIGGIFTMGFDENLFKPIKSAGQRCTAFLRQTVLKVEPHGRAKGHPSTQKDGGKPQCQSQ
jgi:hypothetical protein